LDDFFFESFDLDLDLDFEEDFDKLDLDFLEEDDLLLLLPFDFLELPLESLGIFI
jgi:hypothetical protein